MIGSSTSHCFPATLLHCRGQHKISFRNTRESRELRSLIQPYSHRHSTGVKPGQENLSETGDGAALCCSESRGTAGSGCKLEHLQVGNQTSFEWSINTSLALARAWVRPASVKRRASCLGQSPVCHISCFSRETSLIHRLWTHHV